jgi:hypothetical protein
VRPQFTAQNILGETTPTANHVVQELGFANLGLGIASIVGAWIPGWTVAVAIAPGVFLTLAGIRHITKRHKNTKETLATLSDLLVGIVLVVFVLVTVTR